MPIADIVAQAEALAQGNITAKELFRLYLMGLSWSQIGFLIVLSRSYDRGLV